MISYLPHQFSFFRRPSSLRHDTLNDPKYNGARISRHQISDDDEEEEVEEGEEDEDDEDEEEPPSSEDGTLEAAVSEAPSKRSGPPVPKQKPTVTPSQDDDHSTLRVVSTDDREKGKAVVRQIVRIMHHNLFI